MAKQCTCTKEFRTVDLATEQGKLLMIIDHFPGCPAYPSALDAAVKIANDYPRLQSDFDDAMSMLAVANAALTKVRRDTSLQFSDVSRTLNKTSESQRTEWVEDHIKHVTQAKMASELRTPSPSL